jgi:hypothetical protein
MSSENLVPAVSPDALVFERAALVGTILGCLAYGTSTNATSPYPTTYPHRTRCIPHSGIHLTVFTATAYLMLRLRFQSRSSRKKRLPIWLHLYLWVMFALGTFNFAGSVKYYVEAVIDHRNDPGGPFAWFVQNLSNGVNLFANGAYVVAVFLQDGMLVSWPLALAWC